MLALPHRGLLQCPILMDCLLALAGSMNKSVWTAFGSLDKRFVPLKPYLSPKLETFEHCAMM